MGMVRVEAVELIGGGRRVLRGVGPVFQNWLESGATGLVMG